MLTFINGSLCFPLKKKKKKKNTGHFYLFYFPLVGVDRVHIVLSLTTSEACNYFEPNLVFMEFK
jgi:hypothetical protein